MAQMEGLYLGMGIDTSQLHSDFVDAEKTINQNIARINNEMKLIKIKGQVELEGLDESASSAEKLRIQEEALTEQIGLQQDKIILLGATYEHLIQTRGESAEVTKQVEYQLSREQLAMQRLETQLADLSKQEEIAFGINLELLALIEVAWKGIDMAIAAGRTIPIPHVKAATAAAVGLLAVAEGTREATEELREENPAKVLDENFRQAASSIDDSWQRISESTQRGTAEIQAAVERTSELKFFPDFNEVDFIRIVKVLEDYRPSEAIVNAIELFKQSDSVIGKLSAALLGLGYTTATIGQPFLEYSQTAIDSFRELTKAADELNLPLERANDLMTKIALAGADYNDVRDYVRGVQDAVIKGDSEDPEVLALEKYGVVIQDTNGKLLAFDETLDRLYQGYLKAREAGEAEAYVIMTNGQAVQDVLPYFEKLAQAEEDMAKIEWATMDYATLGELNRNMRLAEMQIEEFKKSLSSLAVPAANMALENTINFFGELTEIVEENREEIIYWSFVLMEGVKSLQDFALGLGGEAKDKILDFAETLKSIDESLGISDKLRSLFADEPVKDIAEEAKESLIPFYTELKKLEEEFGVISELERFLPEGFSQEIDDAINNYLVPFYQVIKDIREEFSITNKLKSLLPEELINGAGEAIDSIFARAKEDLEEFKKANAEANVEIEKTTDYLDGLSYSLNRIAKYKVELENLKFDIQYGKDYSYEKLVAQNKLWYDQAMKDAKQYADEKAIIEEIYVAKSEQIEQEKEQKLAEIRQRISAADKTELEKRIADINREKQTWIQAGMEKAEAEQLAQKQLSDYLNSTRQELSAKVQSLYQTELESRLQQIEQEKQAWIDKCADEVKATELAEQQKADAQRAAAMNVLRQQAKEYRIYQRDGLAGLQDYKQRQLIKSGVAPEFLNMTPQELQQFQRANQIAEKAILPNFMTDRDREMYRREMQESPDDYKNRAKKYDDENYVIYDGKKIPLSSVTGYDKEIERLQNIYNEALGKESDLPNVLSDVEKNFSEMSPVVQSTTESLSELPTAVQGVIEQIEDIPEIEAADMPEIDSSVISEVVQSFSELPTPVQSAAESLSELPTAVQGVMEQISAMEPQQLPQDIEFQSVLSEVAQSFSQLPTVIQSASDSLNQLPITVSGLGENLTTQISQLFSPMSESLTTVTVKFSDVSTRIENVSSALTTFLSALNTRIQQLNTTPNVTNNISIDEAHAWDYSHIQELAEKVADQIEPTILNAVRGNSNSYG